MSLGRWEGTTPPGARRRTRLGIMKAMAEAAVPEESPAREAILSIQSRPTADSSVPPEIGFGWEVPSHEETESPRPALRKRSRKDPKPPGVSLIRESKLESKELTFEVLRPNWVPASVKIASSVPIDLLLM